MGISDKIEAFILELMKREDDEYLKIQRNELADLFGCVPSQINYVISTRFSPEKGYVVVSRRGGGGCVMIRRVNDNGNIGDECSERKAQILIKKLLEEEKITNREAQLIKAASSDISLCSVNNKDKARADILKDMLSVICEEEL